MDRDIDVQVHRAARAIWASIRGLPVDQVSDVPTGYGAYRLDPWVLARAVVDEYRANAPLSVRFGRHTVPAAARPNLDFLLACIAIGPLMKAVADGVGLDAETCRTLAEQIVERLQAKGEKA